ncbi:unnamed protein product [Lactuca saligna]|uniref:Uncharacterized protein n=1 Tax=Lactuca saligna TaxID=75948 RepID=A0AA35ZT20_LACSI|nr:unnamed protein product [Lactuca saligna]
MDAIMKGLGYSVPPVIYYHFQVPKGDMYLGLRALRNDDDVANLAKYVKDHKLIRVYTKHVHDMDAIMKGLGYSVPPVIYYHFRVPKGDMYLGLRALRNDDDVANLAKYVKDHKLIRVLH